MRALYWNAYERSQLLSQESMRNEIQYSIRLSHMSKKGHRIDLVVAFVCLSWELCDLCGTLSCIDYNAIESNCSDTLKLE